MARIAGFPVLTLFAAVALMAASPGISRADQPEITSRDGGARVAESNRTAEAAAGDESAAQEAETADREAAEERAQAAADAELEAEANAEAAASEAQAAEMAAEAEAEAEAAAAEAAAREAQRKKAECEKYTGSRLKPRACK